MSFKQWNQTIPFVFYSIVVFVTFRFVFFNSPFLRDSFSVNIFLLKCIVISLFCGFDSNVHLNRNIRSDCLGFKWWKEHMVEHLYTIQRLVLPTGHSSLAHTQKTKAQIKGDLFNFKWFDFPKRAWASLIVQLLSIIGVGQMFVPSATLCVCYISQN